MRATDQFATAYQTMAIAAGEVFFRRSLMMASGSTGAPDVATMVTEKAATFEKAATKATFAVVKGEDPVGVATSALEPCGTIAAAGVRELRG